MVKFGFEFKPGSAVEQPLEVVVLSRGGKRIGRPRISEQPEFEQRFAEVVDRIGPGRLSRRQAARELGIGYATLKRLLDSQTKQR